MNDDLESLLVNGKEIDKKLIQDVKELRIGIEAIGAYANGIHVSIKEELKIRD